MSDESNSNPYAAPQTVDWAQDTHFDDADVAESLRHRHLFHEAAIRSYSWIFFAVGFLFTLAIISFFEVFITKSQPWWLLEAMVMLLAFVFGLVQIFVGFGLRSLTNFGRIGGSLLSIMGFLLFPIGTIPSSYLLYLFWSEQGKVVFSDQYRAAMRATPHIRYETSRLIKFFATLLGSTILFCVFIIVIAEVLNI